MKRQWARLGLVVTVCSLAGAQDSTNRVVIPARNTGGSRVIEVAQNQASITVKTHPGSDVIAEATGGTDHPVERDGMRRIDVPAGDRIAVTEQDNVIRIQVLWRMGNRRNITLTVPVESSLSLKSISGDITVEGVHGEIDVTTMRGHVTLTNVSGTVVASASLGGLKVSMDRLDPAKPLSFSSLNGNIDVTFPADVKASLKFRTDRGEVWSDFDVAITGRQTGSMHQLGTKGVYRTGVDRNIYATVNGGGVEVGFRTVNGKILLHKKK